MVASGAVPSLPAPEATPALPAATAPTDASTPAFAGLMTQLAPQATPPGQAHADAAGASDPAAKTTSGTADPHLRALAAALLVALAGLPVPAAPAPSPPAQGGTDPTSANAAAPASALPAAALSNPASQPATPAATGPGQAAAPALELLPPSSLLPLTAGDAPLSTRALEATPASPTVPPEPAGPAQGAAPAPSIASQTSAGIPSAPVTAILAQPFQADPSAPGTVAPSGPALLRALGLQAAPPQAGAERSAPSPATASQNGAASARSTAAPPPAAATPAPTAPGNATLLIQAAHTPTQEVRPAAIALISLPLATPSPAGASAAAGPSGTTALAQAAQPTPASAAAGSPETGKPSAAPHATEGTPAKPGDGTGNGSAPGREDAAPAAASASHPDAGMNAVSGAMRSAADPAPAAAPAAPASSVPASSSLPGPAIAQVDGSVRWMLQNGSQEAQLQLHPDSLGQITIALRVEGGAVHARLWVSEPASMQAVQDGRAHLEQSLREQGLQLGSFDLHQGQRPFQEPSAPHPSDVRETPASAPARQETPAPTAPSAANPHQIECYA